MTDIKQQLTDTFMQGFRAAVTGYDAGATKGAYRQGHNCGQAALEIAQHAAAKYAEHVINEVNEGQRR